MLMAAVVVVIIVVFIPMYVLLSSFLFFFIQIKVEKVQDFNQTLNTFALRISKISFNAKVSEEKPTFATDSKFGDLLVVVVPRQGPRIVGAHERF